MDDYQTNPQPFPDGVSHNVVSGIFFYSLTFVLLVLVAFSVVFFVGLVARQKRLTKAGAIGACVSIGMAIFIGIARIAIVYFFG